MKKLTKHIKQLLLTSLLMLSIVINGQSVQKTRILFVFDGSQSMLGQWNGEQKIKGGLAFYHIILRVKCDLERMSRD